MAVSMLSGLMQHVPSSVSEECVRQFHDIVSLLEEASGEDLSLFMIPDARLQKRTANSITGAYGGAPDSAAYSKLRFCNSSFFHSQLHGLSNFLPTLTSGTGTRKHPSYDSLSDQQLQEIMINRKLKPKRVLDHRGETYEYDRAHAIAELMKFDQPVPPPSVTNTYHIHDSNFVQASPGASITQNVGMKAEELPKIIAELKRFSETRELTPDSRAEMGINIGTMELQASSPRPNHHIIRASLESAQAIVEHAAGVVLGESVLVAIKYYLSLP